MAKQVLDEQQYVAKLNETLQQQDWYEPGMAVRLHLPGAPGHSAAGLDVVGGLDGGRLAQIQKVLAVDYDVVVTK